MREPRKDDFADSGCMNLQTLSELSEEMLACDVPATEVEHEKQPKKRNKTTGTLRIGKTLASLDELSARILETEKEPKNTDNKRIIVSRKTWSRREAGQVCGGIYKPKPATREAAMLVAKAPWYAHYTEPTRSKDEQHTKTDSNSEDKTTKTTALPETVVSKREKPRPKTSTSRRVQPVRLLRETSMKTDPKNLTKGVEIKTNGDFIDADDLAAQMVYAIERNLPKEMTKLALAALDARKVLREEMDGIGSVMADFERVSKDLSNEIRNKRMTVVTEASKMTNALKDIRQFFLGPDFEREQKRLNDFVELCERLQALKESGFLDTVADTMIRLASYENL